MAEEDKSALNLPNAITLARLVMAVGLFVLLDAGHRGLALLGLFLATVLTDVLDGWLARRMNLVTPVGRILDPFADKFVVCGSLFFLLPIDGAGVTPWMVTAIVGRELFVSALRGYLESRGIDFSADRIGKLKTLVQNLAVSGALLSVTESYGTPTVKTVRDVLLWLAVAVTVWSWIAYSARAARAVTRSGRES